MLIGSMESARPGQHLCQFYEGRQGLVAALGEFVQTGLAAGDLVVWITGSDAGAARARLVDAGLECEEAYENGQFRVVSAVEVLDDSAVSPGAAILDGLQSFVEGTATEGYAGVRMVSEADLVFGGEAIEETLARERFGGEFVATHEVIGLCLYDRQQHDPDFLRRVDAEHVGRVVPCGEWYRDEILAIGELDGGAGLRVSGEVDGFNRAALQEALAQAVTHTRDEVVVDLSGATFIDVGGLRLFADFASRDGGCRLVLLAPPLSIELLLQLCDWDGHPNLVVISRDEQP